MEWVKQIKTLLSAANVRLSSIKPSEWTEKSIMMGKPFPGPFRYNRTPYTREIIDCLSPDHPARIVAVKKGAQIGFSSGCIIPGLGWIIKNNPGNTYLSVGSPELIEKSMEKIDLMIDSAKLRSLIRPSVLRKKNQKSGDTNFKKEFPGGYITVASANNHKAIRQVDLQYIFMDDFESVKSASKESGDTRKLIEQRAAAYADKSKIFYISTPELKPGSNIEPVYLLGDQRKFHVPCPCCGDYIELQWTVEKEGQTFGITWKEDSSGRLIRDSVGYVCQSCGDFFTDKKKQDMLISGFWKPTAQPHSDGYFSYHISALYAPVGMYDWRHYVENWIEAHPKGQDRKEQEYKAFVNLCLGETYDPPTSDIKANQLQKNIRNYDVCVVPNKMSLNDGNGEIVLITCSADMNGKVDDARLDYEIVAWSESGSQYSVDQGSIGTFKPLGGNKGEDRVIYTYEPGENSVWPIFQDLIKKPYVTESGKRMQIMITGLDTGHYTTYAYDFVDRSNGNVVGLKGKDENKFIRLGADLPYFRKSKERGGLYLVEVNHTKDTISELMNLNWNDERQPAGFMNFPTPKEGKYLYTTYFQHFEAEHKVVEVKEGEGVASRWVKKQSNLQNHFFDCKVYNYAVKEIFVDMVCRLSKIPGISTNPTWKDYCDIVLGRV